MPAHRADAIRTAAPPYPRDPVNPEHRHPHPPKQAHMQLAPGPISHAVSSQPSSGPTHPDQGITQSNTPACNKGRRGFELDKATGRTREMQPAIWEIQPLRIHIPQKPRRKLRRPSPHQGPLIILKGGRAEHVLAHPVHPQRDSDPKSARNTPRPTRRFQRAST